MSGGAKCFLNELTGDFVKFLRADAAVSGMVGVGTAARIYPEAARQGQPAPFIVYTQAGGNSPKNAKELEGCINVTLHVYAYGDEPNVAQALARAIEDRMLPTLNTAVGDGTVLHVCNGGVVDSGYESATDGSDRKRFWNRLVLRMVIGD